MHPWCMQEIYWLKLKGNIILCVGGSKQSSILYFSYNISCITVLYESYRTVMLLNWTNSVQLNKLTVMQKIYLQNSLNNTIRLIMSGTIEWLKQSQGLLKGFIDCINTYWSSDDWEQPRSIWNLLHSNSTLITYAIEIH